MANPTTHDAHLLRHALRYLDHTRELNLTYRAEGNPIEQLLTELQRDNKEIITFTGAQSPSRSGGRQGQHLRLLLLPFQLPGLMEEQAATPHGDLYSRSGTYRSELRS